MDARKTAITFDADGTPRSSRFDDVYFAAGEGLAESRAVFLEGCSLPQAWAGKTSFTIAELGFGSGLNIAAALDLWRKTADPAANLSLFSIETYLMTAEEARRALSCWPEVSDAAAALLQGWPSPARGFQRIELPDFRATLDLAVMDAAEALELWSGAADAWFLDGFSPAKNPLMWSENVLSLVARRSAPGARAATFTVAGSVRRGLSAAGFAVEKRPGHGRKRERLVAQLPASQETTQTASKILIIGGGIAGACLSRTLRRQGAQVTVLDRTGAGAGASGNPVAIVMPAIDAGGGPAAKLYAQAFDHAARTYRAFAPRAVIRQGAVRLAAQPRDARRFDKIAGQDIYAPGAIQQMSAASLSEQAGEPVAGGLAFADGVVVSPADVLAAWLGPVEIAHVIRIDEADDGVRVIATDGRVFCADAVIIAAGWGAQGLAPDLAIRPVRGQASWTDGPAAPVTAAFGGYVAPTRSGLLFGATHDRGRTDTDLDPDDHRRNLASLAKGLPRLAESLGEGPFQGRASIRATSADHLPVAGQLAAGTFVLGGLGSRGFCTAPLLAEHMAALVLDRPSPLPRDLAEALSPLRSGTALGSKTQAV